MKPPHIAIISFIAGALVSGVTIYALKPARVFTPKEVAFLNQKVAESNFPALRTAKWQAWQAMKFFDARKDDAATAELCSRAISEFLVAIDASLARGDLAFMREDIERDRKAALDFIETHPELKR